MNKLLLIATVVFSLSSMANAKIVEILNTSTNQKISYTEFLNLLPAEGHIIMGEFHNNPAIQNAQASIMEDKVKLESLTNNFAFNWEFLNHTTKQNTDLFFSKYVANEITVEELISNTAGKQNLQYAPLFIAAKNLNGTVNGINIPRAIKQKVIKEGIESIDQSLIPQAHYVGKTDYRERFAAAMGGHAPADILEKYFEVQCLTDSVMAEQIYLNESTKLNFSVIGSFHTDFYDGTVVRLKNETTLPISTLKIVNKNDLSSEQLNEILEGDKKYGAYADYIIVAE